MSLIDLKDAFHSIKLTKASKEYCGILPYYGSPHYRYEVLPMGLSISPAKWMECVNQLLKEFQTPSNFIAIMDDILLHSQSNSHMSKLKELLQAIIKHGLKISPKKCQLFRKSLQYMGHVFSCVDGAVTYEPLHSRTEDILKVPLPTCARDCKSFCGLVNYLALFCPELQKLLAPIYDLTRKGRPFAWTDLHTKHFNQVKQRLAKPPVLHCPTPHGRYILYSDTSRKHTGSALWQIQNGSPKLVGFASKTLLPACQNYSVTELEMHGLNKNMELWQYYLGRSEFDAAVDHKAIVAILHSKKPPSSTRVADLLYKLSRFNFRLYYIKGKDMTVADFMSRTPIDKQPPQLLQPVSYDPEALLQESYKKELETQFQIGTRRQYAEKGEVPKDVHGAHKDLNPALKPEHQVRSPVRPKTPRAQTPRPQTPVVTAPPVALPRTPTRNVQIPRPQPVSADTPTTTRAPGPRRPYIRRRILPAPQKEPKQHVPELPDGLNTIPHPPQLPPTPSQKAQLPQTPNKAVTLQLAPQAKVSPHTPAQSPPANFLPDPGFEDPSTFVPPSGDPDLGSEPSEEMLQPIYRKPVERDFRQPPKLEELLEMDPDLSREQIKKHLPRQVDLDKLLTQLKHKILRNTSLPLTLRDLRGAYLSSSHFRDIYVYLTQGALPKHKKVLNSVLDAPSHFFILDDLLFKIIEKPGGEHKAVLCIPTSKVDSILQIYHSSMIGCHTGITKCYLTIADKFYIPNLAHHVRAYITGCHVCQMFKKGKQFERPYEKRVNLNTPALTKIHMDIKHMPKAGPYRYMLVMICEVSNFLIADPMKSTETKEVAELVMHACARYFGSPTYIICDQDPAFTSSLMRYLAQQHNISLVFVSPTNHRSLLAEHGIKSLANMLLKHLEGAGDQWPLYLDAAMMTYNNFDTPNLDGMSPSDLAFGRKGKLCAPIEITPEIPVTGTFREYVTKLRKRLGYLRHQIQKYKDNRQDHFNKSRTRFGFEAGRIVYLYFPSGAALQSGTRKFICPFVGPLVIYKAVAPNQFLLMSIDGMVYPHLIEESRIKPGEIRTCMGNVSTLAELKFVLTQPL